MISWKKPLMEKVCEGKVCRRFPQKMGLFFMIQRIVHFDTFDESFDNYVSLMQGAVIRHKKKQRTLKAID